MFERFVYTPGLTKIIVLNDTWVYPFYRGNVKGYFECIYTLNLSAPSKLAWASHLQSLYCFVHVHSSRHPCNKS